MTHYICVWCKILACVAIRVVQVESKTVIESDAIVWFFKCEVVANVIFLANVTTVENVLKMFTSQTLKIT